MGVLVNKLPELLERRGESMAHVAEATGLAYGTVRHLVLGHTDRFDKKTLDVLCSHFGVQLNEMFEWVPNAVSTERNP